MSKPLHVTLAKALAAYLEAVKPTGYNVHRGMRTGLQKLPSICVAVRKSSPTFDEMDSPVRSMEVDIIVDTLAIFTTAHDCSASEDAHFEAVESVEQSLLSSPVREFVNSENIINRPVANFCLDIYKTPILESGYDHQNKLFKSVLTFRRMDCMASDGD